MFASISLLVCWCGAKALEVTQTYSDYKSLASNGLEFELHWSINDDTVSVGMIAATTGWLGLGFADPGGGGMLGADMVIGKYEDGVGSVEDKWSSAYSTPQDDACNDWSLVFADENATHTVIEAMRALDTGDAQDHVVSATFPRRLIAAFGTTDDFSYHGTNRVSFRLPNADATTLDDLLATDSSLLSYDFLNQDYIIPTAETTSYETCFQVPDSMGEVHLVAMAPKLQESSADYVHHFVLSGYLENNCGGGGNDGDDGDEGDDGVVGDDGGVSDPISFDDDSLSCNSGVDVKWYCDSNGDVNIGSNCDSCGSSGDCELSYHEDFIWSIVDGAGPTCEDDNQFSLSCSSGTLVYTICESGVTLTSENGALFCSCDGFDDDYGNVDDNNFGTYDDDFGYDDTAYDDDDQNSNYADDGYRTDDENDASSHGIFVWARGVQTLVLPSQAGFRVGGTLGYKSLGLKIYYDNPSNDAGVSDSSGVTLYYTSNLRAHDAGVMSFGDPSGTLYDSDVADSTTGLSNHRFACPSECSSSYFGDGEEVTVFGTMFHMRQTGTRAALRKYSKDGVLETTLATEMFDSDFQDNVDIEAMTESSSFTFRGGDQVLLDCYYDETDGDSFSGVFGPGNNDESCNAFVYYWPAENFGSGSSFECSPNSCEEYCGPSFLTDESGFERTFSTPCDESLITYDYTTYAGCSSGVSIVPAPVQSPTASPIATPPTETSSPAPSIDVIPVVPSPNPFPTSSTDIIPVVPSPTASPIKAPTTSPTLSPVEDPDAVPSDPITDDSRDGDGGGSKSSKKSDGGITPAAIALMVCAVLIVIGIALAGIFFLARSRSNKDDKSPDDQNIASEEGVVVAVDEGKPAS